MFNTSFGRKIKRILSEVAGEGNNRFAVERFAALDLNVWEKGMAGESLKNGMCTMTDGYVGRMAPTPSGWLHRGHAYTFGIAYYRARQLAGRIWLRMEDLDSGRCKPGYARGVLEDLRWLGLDWDAMGEGTDGVCYQHTQLERYRQCLLQWVARGWVYPCQVSRTELQAYPDSRQSKDGEWIFPASLRSAWKPGGMVRFDVNWRWRVPDGERVGFVDLRAGKHQYVAGQDFGDFLVWSKQGVPSYEMAVVHDDVASGVTEVVRGEDLLLSTARQLLLYRALGVRIPAFYHCPLVCDAAGVRLAKRYDSESIRSYRERGWSAARFWEDMADFGLADVAGWLATRCS
jgi:glutamyl-tRNA synthetase